MKAVLVTGGTGFIGAHFINAIRARDPGRRCHALVRGNSQQLAAARLDGCLRVAQRDLNGCAPAANFNERDIVLGDIQSERCGVAASTITALAAGGIDEFWHFASSLSFEEERRDHIRAHNIGGAQHAVELAIALQCKHFIYVSTAYTAGELQGPIPEQIHDGIRFNNYYEETKNEAEKLIGALCRESGMSLVILRPSIVIGPMSTKKPAGSNTGLYGFVREMMRMRRLVARRGGGLRISGDPDAGLNLIPVDCLIDDICHIIDNGLHDGAIYHLSADGMPTVGQCVNIIAEVLNIPGVSVERFDGASASAAERTAKARTTFYSGYMGSHKRFLRSIPTRWNVNQEDVRAFVREYVNEAEQLRRLTRATAERSVLLEVHAAAANPVAELSELQTCIST